jgi:UBX domain-containing protein 1
MLFVECSLRQLTVDAQAARYLAAAGGDLSLAATNFFEDQEEDAEDEVEPGHPTSAAPEPEYTGPRTLDGRPAPQSAFGSSSAASRPEPKKKGIATLGSLGASSGHSHPHDDEEEDEDDDEYDDFDERKGPRDLFAGGEKSGLAVQDPAQQGGGAKRIIDDIIAKAKA